MKKVVFIMGAGHCGSTLLDLLLGSHSSGFSLAEFHVISRIIDSTKPIKPKICVTCKGSCDFWDKRVSLPKLANFYSNKRILNKAKGRILRYFFNPYNILFEASQKEMLIDSSKNPYWFKKQLTPTYMWKHITPYLIFLKRDGRAIVNSYLRKYPDKGVEKITKEWINSSSQMNTYYTDFPFKNKTILHYEDLAQHPEQVMKNLCDFLDITFEKEMMLYWSHDHHPIAGNGGTQSLILKYRETLGTQSADYRTKMNDGDKYYQKQYYDDVGLAIRFDERWKKELSTEKLALFDSLGGDLNKDFIYTGR